MSKDTPIHDLAQYLGLGVQDLSKPAHAMTAGMTVHGTSTYHDLSPEEWEHGPLPEWAVGYANGELVLGAQLPTRDGRRCGNAHVIGQRVETISDKAQYVWTLLTDAGSTMQMTDGEVAEQFYPPVWVSDVKDVWRKFGPRDCCYKARETNGLTHRVECDNY